MIKKLLFTLAVFLILQGSIQAAWNSPANKITGLSGTITAIPETVYVPSGEPIDTKDFQSWGWIFYVTTADTCVTDSLIVTLQQSDTRQCSGVVVVWADTTVNDATVDTLTYWFTPHMTYNFAPDTLGDTYWFERYQRLQVRTTKQTTAHADTCMPDGDEGPNDWSNTDAAGYTEVDEAIGSEDTTTAGGYVYVTDKDSFECFGTSDISTGKGYVDSIVIFILACEADSLGGAPNVAIHCSLDYAVCIGDTSECTWNGTFGVTADTVRYTMLTTTSPTSGVAWVPSGIDSILIALKSVYVDTVAAGTQDLLKVFQAGARVYWDNDTYYDMPKWKARVILKE